MLELKKDGDSTVRDIIETFEKRNPSINNECHPISEWCKIYNIKIATVNARIRKGWSSEKAIITPVKGVMHK